MSVIADPESDRRAGVSTGTLLLACLPAVAVGLLIRAWLMHTSLVRVQRRRGRHRPAGVRASCAGNFRLIVAGNDYGSTTETYLFAPLLAFWSGVWPLRIVPTALSAVAAYALYRLARPIFGRVPAAALALIGWTISGAVTILFLRPYMGYTTGFIALIAALALACHAMRTERAPGPYRELRRVRRGVRDLEPSDLRHCRAAGLDRADAVPLAGAAPVVAAGRRPAGCSESAPGWCSWRRTACRSRPAPVVVTTYPERVIRFFTELLPRAFGLRSRAGWGLGRPRRGGVSGPRPCSSSASIVGMVLLVVRKGNRPCRSWWPGFWRSRCSRCTRRSAPSRTGGTPCRSCRSC